MKTLRNIVPGLSGALLGCAGLVFSLTGCAMPMSPGPVVAHELAELRDGHYTLLETREHDDRTVTLGLVAHDGVLVEPKTPEEEAWLLNPEDRALEIIERLHHNVPLARRTIVPFW